MQGQRAKWQTDAVGRYAAYNSIRRYLYKVKTKERFRYFLLQRVQSPASLSWHAKGQL